MPKQSEEILLEREEIIGSFLKGLVELEDPRSKRGRSFSLGEIFLLILCAQVCGFESLREYEVYGEMKLELLRRFLPYKKGVPSKSTLCRILALFKPKYMEELLIKWMSSIVESTPCQNHIAIDGKTHRGAQATEEGEAKLHTVHAYAVESGLLLGQVSVSEKSNEITAIPSLLEVLQIEKQIVTIDAMGCQKGIAKRIREKKADYVLALKGNQGQLHEDVELYFNGQHYLSNCQQCELRDKGHGRLEIRRCYVTDQISWLGGREAWKDLKSIAKVECIRIQKGKESREERYFMSSLKATPQKLLNAVRGHWGIENNLHWSLDVIFAEDERIIWNRNFARNEGVIRRIALNLLKKFREYCEYNKGKSRIAIKTLRKLLTGNDANMEKLVLGIL